VKSSEQQVMSKAKFQRVSNKEI